MRNTEQARKLLPHRFLYHNKSKRKGTATATPQTNAEENEPSSLKLSLNTTALIGSISLDSATLHRTRLHRASPAQIAPRPPSRRVLLLSSHTSVIGRGSCQGLACGYRRRRWMSGGQHQLSSASPKSRDSSLAVLSPPSPWAELPSLSPAALWTTLRSFPREAATARWLRPWTGAEKGVW